MLHDTYAQTAMERCDISSKWHSGRTVWYRRGSSVALDTMPWLWQW
jgi:hypothetical protein